MSDTRRVPALDSILQDLRYTFRTLRRDPGFTTFAILIVGLGIGASATVFSVVDALLLRPLPFREPERLVWIANHDTSGLSGQTTQVGHLLDLRERNQSFTDLAAYFAFYGVGDNLLSGATASRSGSAACRCRRISSRCSEFNPNSADCLPPRNANGTGPRPCC